MKTIHYNFPKITLGNKIQVLTNKDKKPVTRVESNYGLKFRENEWDEEQHAYNTALVPSSLGRNRENKLYKFQS